MRLGFLRAVFQETPDVIQLTRRLEIIKLKKNEIDIMS